MSDGQLCPGGYEITSEIDCIAAANDLHLDWGGSWVGPGDFPKCLFANDDRKKVYFNKSPNPSETVHGKMLKYAAICQRSSKGPLFYYIIKRKIIFFLRLHPIINKVKVNPRKIPKS